VAKDDDVGIVASGKFCRGRTADFVTVTDVHANTVDFKGDFFAQAGLTRRIGVAEHSFDWGDQPELVEDAGAANITRVNDELDPRQCLMHSRAKQPVCIRD